MLCLLHANVGVTTQDLSFKTPSVQLGESIGNLASLLPVSRTVHLLSPYVVPRLTLTSAKKDKSQEDWKVLTFPSQNARAPLAFWKIHKVQNPNPRRYLHFPSHSEPLSHPESHHTPFRELLRRVTTVIQIYSRESSSRGAQRCFVEEKSLERSMRSPELPECHEECKQEKKHHTIVEPRSNPKFG